MSSQAAKLAEAQGYTAPSCCPVESWTGAGSAAEPGKQQSPAHLGKCADSCGRYHREEQQWRRR